ncbi:MAG: transcriptional repressor LexA, partial [Spirochaetaceae bacterium]
MTRTEPGKTYREVYHFVRRRILAGLPPTVREVQEAFGFRAVQSAREHLEKLVAEGRLQKVPGKSRGYRLPEGEHPASELVPLLGRVQAGALTTAVEDTEGYIPVRSHFDSAELFALRVRGESMRDAAILDGDIVIVRRSTTAEHRDIVVALVEDEATVKRFIRRENHIELHPENPAYSPIVPQESAQFSLLGTVIEVRRYYDTPVRRDDRPS